MNKKKTKRKEREKGKSDKTTFAQIQITHKACFNANTSTRKFQRRKVCTMNA